MAVGKLLAGLLAGGGCSEKEVNRSDGSEDLANLKILQFPKAQATSDSTPGKI